MEFSVPTKCKTLSSITDLTTHNNLCRVTQYGPVPRTGHKLLWAGREEQESLILTPGDIKTF